MVKHEFIVLLTSFLLGIICVPTIMKLALHFKIVAQSNFRRKHESPIPLLGGVGIFVALVLTGALYEVPKLWIVLLSAIPLLIAGILDDMRELSARYKSLAHILSLGIWFYLVPTEQLVLSQLGIPPALAIGFTAFWIMGLVNAMNMIDGMDGVSAGTALIIAFSLPWLGADPHSQLMSLAIAGCLAAFLIYNFEPAKVYLGDAGSNFLGFALAALASTIQLKSTTSGQILVPLFVLAFPEFDACLAMLRRARSGTSLMRGDHDHIHHKLKKIGFNVKQSWFIIMGVGVVCSMTAWSISEMTDSIRASVIAFSMAGTLLGVIGLIQYLEHRMGEQVSHLSQTLIAEHIPLLPMAEINPDHFRATVYDLLPYYKEISQRGINQIRDFVFGFSQLVKELHPDSQFIMVGSYTVVAVESGLIPSTDKKVTTQFFTLLKKYHAQKNDGDRPWGLSFYDPTHQGDQFLRRMHDRVTFSEKRAA